MWNFQTPCTFIRDKVWSKTLSDIRKEKQSNPRSFLGVFIHHLTCVLQSVFLSKTRAESVRSTCNPSCLWNLMHWKPDWQHLEAASLGCRKAQDYWTKRWTRPDSLRSENSEAEELRIQTPEVKEHKCVPSRVFINMSVSSAHYVTRDNSALLFNYNGDKLICVW